MGMTDPIADMLTRIRNANAAKHETVCFPHSIIKEKIVEILKEHGFINRFNIIEHDKKKEITVTLKYTIKEEKVIFGLTRVSKCGKRVYVDKENIPSVQGGLGIAIISTSKGIITDKKARKLNTGGEVLCYVW
jgi:small subunit ribosomal protein S8